jgi:hypothetical protein
LNPHPFLGDPDPGFKMFEDPEPGFEIFADPDRDPGLDLSKI